MTKSSPPPVRRAFTLIELLVVIVTIGILAAIFVPAFNSVLERAKATKDMSNLRQIGAFTQMYLNDKDGDSSRLRRLGIGRSQPGHLSQNTSEPDAFSNRLSISGPLRKPTTGNRVSYGINQTCISGGVCEYRWQRCTKLSHRFDVFDGTRIQRGNPAVAASWAGTATGVHRSAGNPGGADIRRNASQSQRSTPYSAIGTLKP